MPPKQEIQNGQQDMEGDNHIFKVREHDFYSIFFERFELTEIQTKSFKRKSTF